MSAPESNDDFMARARARGLALDDVAEAIRPGVESLSARLRALGASLKPDDAPLSERCPRDPR